MSVHRFFPEPTVAMVADFDGVTWCRRAELWHVAGQEYAVPWSRVMRHGPFVPVDEPTVELYGLTPPRVLGVAL